MTRSTGPSRSPGRGDRGSAALELTLAAPVLLVLLALVLVYARVGQVGAALDSGVRDAARSATRERSPAAATVAARDAVLAAIGPGDCADSLVVDPLPAFVPGRAVTVTAHCRYAIADLGLLGSPGSLDVGSSFSAPLDPNREIS